VEPGQHDLRIRHPGYPEERRQVFALAGISIPVAVSLETLKRERANDERAAQLMGTSEGQMPVPGEEDDLSTTSTVTLITTSTLAAVGLAGGLYFTVAANQHESNADGMALMLGGVDACNESTPFRNTCDRFHREQDDGRSDRQRAAISFAGLGVASAATIGYALWLAFGDEPEEAQAMVPDLRLSPDSAALSLTARF
jgi:hypothetical protein